MWIESSRGHTVSQNKDGADFQAVELDIRNEFPEARFKWDTGMVPYMLEVTLPDVRVRVFVDPVEISARGVMYRRFVEGIVEKLGEKGRSVY